MKTIKIIKNEKNRIGNKEGNINTDITFSFIQKDQVGKSGARPIWGNVFHNNGKNTEYNGVALYKEYDYDNPSAAYSEKVWSIFGRELLLNVRVPQIEIVEDSKLHNYPACLSYRTLDNDREDAHHLSDVFYSIFERDEVHQKKGILTIDELLLCVHNYLQDEENYKEVKKEIIQVLLLDAITNNGDRHGLNWALVRDKQTNHHQLAVFDHAGSFVDMLELKIGTQPMKWNISYTTVGKDVGRNDMGSMGNNIVTYIAQTYPEYFEEFVQRLEEKSPSILQKVQEQKMKVDMRVLERCINSRKSFLNRLMSKGEMERE